MPTVPLIVSLGLDAPLFAALNELRRRHFPPDRNMLDAHVTLFHQLPGEHVEQIGQTLESIARQTPAFDVSAASLRFLGKGVAVDLTSDPLISLRSELAREWVDWLTPQDRQRFFPHVTIQNKTDPAIARRTFQTLKSIWSPLAGRGEKLELWWYRGGPWEIAGTFDLN